MGLDEQVDVIAHLVKGMDAMLPRSIPSCSRREKRLQSPLGKKYILPTIARSMT